MKRLRAIIEEIRNGNREVALLCCMMIDDLRKDLTPAKLECVQEGLQVGLYAVEAEIRTFTARKRRRTERLRQRCGRNKKLWRLREIHDRLLEVREELLERQRRIFLQAGDACAWLVLRAEPRLILPLYSSATMPHQPQ